MSSPNSLEPPLPTTLKAPSTVPRVQNVSPRPTLFITTLCPEREHWRIYTAPKVLLGDEIGYHQIDRLGANLILQLINRRYKRGPMILPSNQSFGAWGEVFGDWVIAAALLDRVLQHAITVIIRGNSYRLKVKLKAGLVQPAEAVS